MRRFVKSRQRLFSSCFFVSFVVGFSLLAGCAGGEPKHPTWSNATGAEQHERLMWKAIQAKDWVNVERRLSATFVGVNAAGQVFDRAGWLTYWKGAAVTESSLGDVSVQPEGADMKVTYVLQLKGEGGKASGPAAGLRVVSVWQEHKPGWMLISQSATPIM